MVLVISKNVRNILVLLIFICFLSCNKKEEIQPKTLFTLLDPTQTGVTFSNDIKDEKEISIFKYANFYGGAGVGVGDFNNDGLQDLFFCGNLVADRLYINKGNLEFEDVTAKAGIKVDQGWSTGVSIADINNDGYQDIYVSRELYDDKPDLRKNLLYINNGDGTFEEKADVYGIADNQRTRHATFLDYNNDGWLDLFLLTQPPNPGNFSEFKGTTLLLPEYHLKLFKNTGNSFVDVSKAANVNLTGFPNGVSASDLNNDGYTDLYVANDFYAPDFLLLNKGDGTFANKADDALKHMPYYSMGVDVADINNDNLLDIFVVDMVAEDNYRLKSNMSGMNIDDFWKVVDNGGHYQYMYNTIQLSNGNTTYSDVAQFTGMQATDWSWSNLLADFDNDGLKDAYVTNGLLRDIRNTDADKEVGQYVLDTANKWIKDNPNAGDISIWDILDLEKALSFLPSQPLANYAFKNEGDLKFKKMMEDWGLDQKSFSNGSAYADLDNDGDLDLIVNNINEPAFVYQNNAEKLNNTNFLRAKLVTEKNTPIFGTRATLYTTKGIQTQEITNVRGIYSTSESILHFGVHDINTIDSLVIVWPNQTKSIQKNIAANQQLTISNKDAQYFIRKKSKSLKVFEPQNGTTGFDFVHEENEYDDFEKQILLPHKLSQFGPALATGDINNDGLDDFYIGGATGQAPKLYEQQKDGSFMLASLSFFEKEAPYEDVDALFADINGDGYQDLFVVSGGNAWKKNDYHYTHRLYLNTKDGKFSKGALLNSERISGAVARAEDFDKDGDIDVFVGGRHLPGEYPKPTSSMLFSNENGQLINKTKDIAPELQNIGMVTDAVWMDYDNDNDIDLFVVGEWMLITLFENVAGKFKKNDTTSFEKSSGWWFSIEKGDFDNDGDLDLIAGNLGLNYKYKTSTHKPFDIYFNDFDENGKGDIVLGYHNNDKHYPLRGFSCSSQQIPGLKDKIQKYNTFASLELDEVYSPEKLQAALYYKADTFQSVYIENQGNGQFNLHPLPYSAQLSNINDMLVADFNIDGNLDVLAIQNLYVSEIETPRNDAGTGVYLLGNGDGTFTAHESLESGFYTTGDAKKIQLLSSKDDKFILVANNNDALQTFKINKP